MDNYGGDDVKVKELIKELQKLEQERIIEYVDFEYLHREIYGIRTKEYPEVKNEDYKKIYLIG